MTSRRHLRRRLFLLLGGVALIPVALALLAGALLLREFVVTTGTAGAWDQVAESGRLLLEAVEATPSPSPALVAAAEAHREGLAASVRFSRLYSFLGERLLLLLPFIAVALLLLAAGVAAVTANWLSRRLSRPVEELVQWTDRIGAGAELPPAPPGGDRGGPWEFLALRQALRRTAGTLEEARAREAERIRTQSWSEMARRVAHELKNPLTPMRMAAESVATAENPRLAAAGKVLLDEIRRLDALARTFAQFGRPVEGPTSRIDLGELLSSLARRLATERSPIDFTSPPGPVEVEGHLEALERVVRNLLANAQEASATGIEGGAAPPVEIRLSVRGRSAEIRILDRGPGIPPELLPRIWEPDFTTKRRGTGLGLALVRQAILAHGGEVGAANREGGGADFLVRLPIEPPTPDSGFSNDEAQPRLRSPGPAPRAAGEEARG